jgi:astacin
MRFLFTLLIVCLAFTTAFAAEAPVSVASRSWEGARSFKADEAGPTAKLPTLSPDSVGAFQTAEDGTRFLTIRFILSGAPATRLHLTDLRLASGSRVFVYGIDNGAVTNIAGPYTGAGSDIDGSLWTGAVRGSEIVLELQEGTEAVADLPFTVAEIAAASIADTETPGASASAPLVRTSLFRGLPVTHEVVGDLGVFEGDIILGEMADLRPATATKSASRSAVAITGANYRWPGGVMPYSIDPAMPNASRVTSAVDHWNKTMAGVVKLVPRTSESAYVYFYRSPSAGQCASSVGRLGYGQYLYVGDSCAAGNLIHEIGHAFGLWHEQSREDRNNHVVINWANIDSSATYNFNQNISDGDDINAYDYGSIMHYAAYAFSMNGKPTIETIPAGIAIGQRSSLSAGDIAAIKALYPVSTPVTPPPAATPVAITVSTNPAGVPVVVDGKIYNSSTVFNWLPGSAHVVSAQTTYVGAGGRYAFQRWSDNGSTVHMYMTPSSASVLSATYAVAYAVTTAVTGAGTAQITPVSSDTYYPAQSAVTVQASPASGYCFTGWTGLIAGTPATANLTVTQGYKLTATFQPGSVNVNPASLLPSANGGSYVVNVAANSGCAWMFQSPVSWVRLGTAAPSSGSAALTLVVDANTSGLIRTATVNIGSATVRLTQGPKR